MEHVHSALSHILNLFKQSFSFPPQTEHKDTKLEGIYTNFIILLLTFHDITQQKKIISRAELYQNVIFALAINHF